MPPAYCRKMQPREAVPTGAWSLGRAKVAEGKKAGEARLAGPGARLAGGGAGLAGRGPGLVVGRPGWRAGRPGQ